MELSFSSCLNTWLFGLIAISLLRVLLSGTGNIGKETWVLFYCDGSHSYTLVISSRVFVFAK